MARIARILSAEVKLFMDSGDEFAYVGWEDTNGKRGVTVGHRESTHMDQLIRRALREGHRVPITTF